MHLCEERLSIICTHSTSDVIYMFRQVAVKIFDAQCGVSFPRGRANNKEAKRDSSAWVLFNDLQAQIVEEESSNFRMEVVCYPLWDQQPRGRISSLPIVLTYFFE
jgi:hypothetical protein